MRPVRSGRTYECCISFQVSRGNDVFGNSMAPCSKIMEIQILNRHHLVDVGGEEVAARISANLHKP